MKHLLRLATFALIWLSACATLAPMSPTLATRSTVTYTCYLSMTNCRLFDEAVASVNGATQRPLFAPVANGQMSVIEGDHERHDLWGAHQGNIIVINTLDGNARFLKAVMMHEMLHVVFGPEHIKNAISLLNESLGDNDGLTPYDIRSLRAIP